MHYDLENLTYTPSDGGKVTTADNTDFSMSGTSKKITFADALNEYLDIGFDSVDATEYEELVFYLYTSPKIAREDLFKITVGGQDYTLGEYNAQDKFWLIRIPAEDLGTITSIRITCLKTDLVMFFDLPMLRKATYDAIDDDILEAMADHISLDYGVSTTLEQAAAAGATDVDLVSKSYIFDHTKIRLTDGATTEDVRLKDRSGELRDRLTNAYPAGATVTALCPVSWGRSSAVQSDPVCGVIVTDREPGSDEHCEYLIGGKTRFRNILGGLIVMVYIECTSMKKTFSLARQFERDYGDEFQFLLDGERVDAYMIDSGWVGKELGGMARQTYTYAIRPQGLTIKTAKPISDLTLDLESEENEN